MMTTIGISQPTKDKLDALKKHVEQAYKKANIPFDSISYNAVVSWACTECLRKK